MSSVHQWRACVLRTRLSKEGKEEHGFPRPHRVSPLSVIRPTASLASASALVQWGGWENKAWKCSIEHNASVATRPWKCSTEHNASVATWPFASWLLSLPWKEGQMKVKYAEIFTRALKAVVSFEAPLPSDPLCTRSSRHLRVLVYWAYTHEEWEQWEASWGSCPYYTPALGQDLAGLVETDGNQVLEPLRTRLGPDSSSSPGYSFVAKTGEGLSVLWGVVFPPAYMRAQSAVWYWVHLLFSLLWAGEDGRERDSGLTAIQTNIASSKFLFFDSAEMPIFYFAEMPISAERAYLQNVFKCIKDNNRIY